MEPSLHTVAIPRLGDYVAPCFESTATVAIFTTRGSEVTNETDFVLQSPRELDRVRLLCDQEVDTLICGGVQGGFETIITANGIRVISWVRGTVEELLESFLRGELRPGHGRGEATRPPTPTPFGGGERQ